MIYVIRHGQTEWNLAGRLQGGKDSLLTAQGKLQAEAAAISFGKTPPGKILSSPLGRARKTAEIIAKALDIPVEEDERLAELRFGAAEGLTLDKIDKKWPGFRERREEDKWHVRWPDGESYQDVDARITSLSADIPAPFREADARPLALVGHETVNMILMGRLLQLDPSMVTRIGQPNHVVYRLDGRLVDHAHLGDDDLEWIPGLLQKRSDEVLHLAA